MHARHTTIALVCAALAGMTLGACFTGEDARGLPCTADIHCGTQLQCINGFCGGVFACSDGSEIAAEDVCDGDPDCPDSGNDEHPDLCGTDAFFCGDDTTIPLQQVCDGTPDCADGSDEAGLICTQNACSDTNAFSFGQLPAAEGTTNPLGIFPGDLAGNPQIDLLYAQDGGTFVRLIEFSEMGPLVHELPGDNDNDDPLPNFLSPVLKVVVYDIEQDGDDDLVVLTEESKIFGYYSDPPALPMQIVIDDPIEPKTYVQPPFGIIDVALGKVDDDPFADLVVLTPMGGVLTAIGNPDALANGGAPFEFSLMNTTAVTGATQLMLANIDAEGPDELLVLSQDGAPQLTVGRVKDGAIIIDDAWELGAPMMLPFLPDEFAAGNTDGTAGLDLAMLRSNGDLALFNQTSPGVFGPQGPLLMVGTAIHGLLLEDIDCNGREDLIFNVESPAAVQVAFVSNMGVPSLERSLVLASDGLAKGQPAAVQFDGDASWDFFHLVDAGLGLTSPEIRAFVSQAAEMP